MANPMLSVVILFVHSGELPFYPYLFLKFSPSPLPYTSHHILSVSHTSPLPSTLPATQEDFWQVPYFQ